MKIIVGLGNPSKKYTPARHNAGFLALDLLSEKLKAQSEKEIEFKPEKKFDAEVAKFKLGKEDILLVKPQTFMNNSGIAVKKIVDFYKINSKKDLIVVYDDIDIELGKIRIKDSGSSAGHNGVQSVIDNLGTKLFLRVRIGIGRPQGDMEVEDYVLGKFSAKEEKIIKESIDKFVSEIWGYIGK